MRQFPVPMILLLLCCGCAEPIEEMKSEDERIDFVFQQDMDRTARCLEIVKMRMLSYDPAPGSGFRRSLSAPVPGRGSAANGRLGRAGTRHARIRRNIWRRDQSGARRIPVQRGDYQAGRDRRYFLRAILRARWPAGRLCIPARARGLAAGRARAARPLVMQPNGWIILDKPVGLGSTQAVGAVKRNLREAGILARSRSAMAARSIRWPTGVLPIALGEATKLAGRMLDADKIYEFTIRFGEQTDTLDAEGRGGRDQRRSARRWRRSRRCCRASPARSNRCRPPIPR